MSELFTLFRAPAPDPLAEAPRVCRTGLLPEPLGVGAEYSPSGGQQPGQGRTEQAGAER